MDAAAEKKAAKRRYMQYRRSLGFAGGAGAGSDKSAAEIAALARGRDVRASQKRERNEQQNKAERCTFYMAKKRRCCKQPRLPGMDLCGNHVAKAAMATADATRAACEHCGTVIRVERMTRHIAVCGVLSERKASEARPFYCAGINSGDALSSSAPTAPAPSTRSFAEAIWRCFAQHVEGTIERIPPPATAAADAGQGLGLPRIGVDSVIAKHSQQERALVEVLRRGGILSASTASTANAAGGGNCPTLFAEFGAGKGMLSLALREALPAARVVLIEREGGSGKSNADKVLRRSECGARFERVRIDIRDFDLAAHPLARCAATAERESEVAVVDASLDDASSLDASVEQRLCDVVAISKHLCGAATDLALRCLVNFRGQSLATNQSERGLCGAAAASSAAAVVAAATLSWETPLVRGAAIAMCCHGLCDWSTYVNKPWLRSLGVDAATFERMKRCAAWATLKREEGDDVVPAAVPEIAVATVAGRSRGEGEGEAAAAGAEAGLGAETKARTGEAPLLSRNEMRRVGWCCKRLLDAGRARWLSEQCPELDVKLIEYCPSGVTVENIVLRAVRRDDSGGGRSGEAMPAVARC